MNMIYKSKNITINLLWKIFVNTYFILYSSKYLLKKVKPILNTLFYYNNMSIISVIGDGKIIYDIPLSNNKQNIENYLNPVKHYIKKLNYDFFLYNYCENKEEPTYIIRRNKFSELRELREFIVTRTNYEFNAIILIYKGDKFRIILNDYRKNFYIVNNCILDYNFIKYYMNQYYNILLEPDEIYDIYVLDNECVLCKLQKKDYIILKEDNYDILVVQDIDSTENEITEYMLDQFNSENTDDANIDDANIDDANIDDANIDDENIDDANIDECEHLSEAECNNIPGLYSQNQIDNTKKYMFTQRIYKFFNWYEY